MLMADVYLHMLWLESTGGCAERQETSCLLGTAIAKMIVMAVLSQAERLISGEAVNKISAVSPQFSIAGIDTKWWEFW